MKSFFQFMQLLEAPIVPGVAPTAAVAAPVAAPGQVVQQTTTTARPVAPVTQTPQQKLQAALAQARDPKSAQAAIMAAFPMKTQIAPDMAKTIVGHYVKNRWDTTTAPVTRMPGTQNYVIG